MMLKVFLLFLNYVLFYMDDIQGLDNLALRKFTWKSHPWPNKGRNFRSENAVDGLYTDRSAAGGQCTISDDGIYSAEWGVDLGKVVSISYIKIYYRTDNKHNPCPYVDQLAGFSLHVSNSSKKEEGFNCFHDFSFRPDLLSCDRTINCSVNGRYVIFYNERRKDTSYPRFFSEYAHIDLCEVEVYGCSDSFGEECQHLCPSTCQGKTCNINTGHCFGCVPGYRDLTCSQCVFFKHHKIMYSLNIF